MNTEINNDAAIAEQSRLKELDSRDQWLWWVAIAVILLLTAAVVLLAVGNPIAADPLSQLSFNQAIRGLVGVVLIFSIYAIYQQTLIKRLRRQIISEQIVAQELRELSLRDPLTGLYNRRMIQFRLPEELGRSQRSSAPLTVLSLDLNSFKQINDRHGHLAGDLVLKAFASRLQKSVRNCDVALRTGGDEFLVLLPDCRSEQVQSVLKRLGRLEVELETSKISVAYSAGWASHKPGETPEELLERADLMMYRNKRDQSKIAGGTLP